VEYSDMPEDLKSARGADGGLLFPQGSIAIHIFSVDFLLRADLHLPYHLARKSVQALNPVPRGTDIQEEEAIKMESFVFDTIPLARRALFFEVERAEEFAPLKNREGVDSVETCLRGQVEKAARWLEACGVQVSRDARGLPAHAIEISPLFAADPGILAAKRGSLKDSIDEDTLLA
jgi:UDP-N-acetylglucosamine/UDP-N-acetylgalactosamine diphosphorylase